MGSKAAVGHKTLHQTTMCFRLPLPPPPPCTSVYERVESLCRQHDNLYTWLLAVLGPPMTTLALAW